VQAGNGMNVTGIDRPLTVTAGDGVTLACRVAPGDPGLPCLLLLHGMGSNLTRWSEFFNETTLRPRYPAVRPDLRGHGSSQLRARASMELWCGDLALVMDAAGCRSSVAIGHSMGALLALWFALRQPHRVSALVLVEPSFSRAMAGVTPWLRHLHWLFTAAGRTVLALNRMGLHRRRLPMRDLWEWDERARRELLDVERRDEMVKLYKSVCVDLRYNATASYLQDFAQVLRPLPPLDAVRAPCLTLLSSDSTFADRDTTMSILSVLPDNRVVTLPATHWIMTETPRAARNLIDDWCERITGGAQGGSNRTP
jgi:pimeloyl-ACP methyl ester carboxylesterase